MRRLLTALLAMVLVASVACHKRGPTGVALTIITVTPGLAIDTFRIRADFQGEPGREDSIALSGRTADPTETVNLTFERRRAGREVSIIVEALRAGESVRTGRTQVTLEKDKLVRADVQLLSCAAPEGPFCDGDELMDCNRDTDSTTRTLCPFGCNVALAQCNECQPDTATCDAGVFVRCDAEGNVLSSEDCTLLAGPCREGTCTDQGCTSTPIPDDTPCDDGLFCTVNTTCFSGACSGGAPNDCDDGNACTYDVCDEKNDVCIPDTLAKDGASCTTGSFCLVEQTCFDGLCGGGKARTCDDGNSCTDDSCNETKRSCEHAGKPDLAACEDGAFCTLGDFCQSGVCQPGPASPCRDANPCTNDSCNEADDTCSFSCLPAGTLCTDSASETTCDGACSATTVICPYGCNSTRNICNECDPNPTRVVTCRADIEYLCNAEFVCNSDGLIVFKSCCSSNQCTCDGLSCLEDVCESASDFSSGGTFTGNTCDDADNIPGDCSPGGQACRSPADGGAPEELFQLTLDDSSSSSVFYNVVLDSTASTTNTALRLSTTCGSETLQVPTAQVCAAPIGRSPERACIDEPGPDALVLCGLPEGQYFGAVDSEAGQCGPFSVDVNITPVSLDSATEAGNISRGGTFTGNTCGLTDLFSFPNTQGISGCTGLGDCSGSACPACDASAATDCRVDSTNSICAYSGAGSPDAVFYLALAVDSGVDISTAGSSFDTVLYITEAGPNGASPPGAVRLCNDDCFAADGASHIQTSLPAGLYYVFLDGAGGACGNYVLHATVSPASTCPNLTCDVPFETCESCPSDCRCQRCGDGIVQAADGEQCDDGGTSSNDGCSAKCVIEKGYKCQGEPSACAESCGDGVIDEALGEECDDGNARDGDGCGSACLIESGFVCNGAPSICSYGTRITHCPSLGIPDNLAAGVSDTIVVTDAFVVGDATVDVDITHTYIGDLVVSLSSPGGSTVTLHNGSGTSAENISGNYDITLTPDGPGTLDDFNGQSSTGSWTLTVSDNAALDLGTLNCWGLNLTPTPSCGNGLCEAPFEDCVSCPADCLCTNCGDGLLQRFEGETCDDMGVSPGDGCDGNCGVEAGFKCTGEPSICMPHCGDGVIDTTLGETCDDGGTQPNDGCSANCTQEPGYLCSGLPSVCVPGIRVESCPSLAIPDNRIQGVTTGINVPLSCTAANVLIEVDITHTWISDLIVEVSSPSNTTVRLHDRSGADADNIVGTYDSSLLPDGPGSMDDFNSETSSGTWTLFASDRVGGDVGAINCWAVIIECQ